MGDTASSEVKDLVPINSRGKDIIELYDYNYGDILDIEKTDAIIRGLPNIKYEVMSGKKCKFSTLQTGTPRPDNQADQKVIKVTNGIFNTLRACSKYLNIVFPQSHVPILYKKARLEITLYNKCIIPLELLVLYYLYCGKYSEVRITIKIQPFKFRIRISDLGIYLVYYTDASKYYIVLPLWAEIYSQLFPMLHTLFNHKMSNSLHWCDTVGTILFSTCVKKFFTYSFYNSWEVLSMIKYGINIKCLTHSGLPHLFVPYDENIKWIFNRSFYTINEYTDYKTIQLPNQPFVIRCKGPKIDIISKDIYEDNSIFKEDNSIDINNVTIYGLAHVYSYVNSFSIFEKEDLQKIADRCGLKNDEELQQNIIKMLDRI